MPRVTTRTETNTAKTQNAGSNFVRNNLFTFFATMSGVVIGVLASLAMIAPTLQSEVASATKQATRNLSANLASDTQSGSCSLNSGGAANGSGAKASVQTASASMPELGGKGGDEGTPAGGNSSWVHSFVSGVWSDTNASISNTGQGSDNSISTVNKNTTKVDNHNDITVTNSNGQGATSGSATTSSNTNGGSAASGQSVNTNDSSTSVNVTN